MKKTQKLVVVMLMSLYSIPIFAWVDCTGVKSKSGKLCEGWI
jgi:hypothetical protein